MDEVHTARLIVRLEGSIVERFTLPGGAAILLGRLPGSDLVLPHPLVSRAHAEVRRGGAGLILTDLDSSNGTFVGGERLPPNQPHILRPGGAFGIGPFDIIFEAEATATGAGATDGAGAEDETASAAPQEPSAREAEEAFAAALEAVSEEWSLLDGGRGALPERRPTLPVPLPASQSSRYMAHLPLPFHERGGMGTFIERFLLIFEAIWEPLEQRQDAIDMYFDPLTCPASFLPWLASWMDFDGAARGPEHLRRELLGEAVDLYRWRGTRYGLSRMIEVATGFAPAIDEVEPHVFRVRIKETVEDEETRALIETLILTHKPAHAGYILEMAS